MQNYFSNHFHPGLEASSSPAPTPAQNNPGVVHGIVTAEESCGGFTSKLCLLS